MSSLTIQVDDEIAEAYSAASQEERQKIQTLVNLWLRELTKSSDRPIQTVMDELSENACNRGLTPEILSAILQQR